MKSSHCEDKHKDRHLDILTDQENGLQIIVSRLSAELISLARINEADEWTGFLYRNKRSVSAVSGLGYYLHRLKKRTQLI